MEKGTHTIYGLGPDKHLISYDTRSGGTLSKEEMLDKGPDSHGKWDSKKPRGLVPTPSTSSRKVLTKSTQIVMIHVALEVEGMLRQLDPETSSYDSYERSGILVCPALSKGP